MRTPVRFFDRLENIQYLDKHVQARWDGVLYHDTDNIDPACGNEGKTVKVNLLDLVRDDTLCPHCDYGLTGMVSADFELSSFRYLTESHDCIHDPSSAPLHERFNQLEVFLDETFDPHQGHNPAPTWESELLREGRALRPLLIKQMTSDTLKELALCYVTSNKDVRKRIKKIVAGELLPEPPKPYRTQGVDEPRAEYIRDLRLHHTARTLLDEVGIPQDVDLTPVLFAVPESTVETSEHGFLALTHYKTYKAFTHLGCAPKVVVDFMVTKFNRSSEKLTSANAVGLTPDHLDVVVDMWDPQNTILGNLDKLIEAAKLIR